MTDRTEHSIRSFIEAHRDELLDLVKELCRIPAPSHMEDKRAAFIKQWLEQNGATNVVIDRAKNVICPFGMADEQSIAVLMAHTDTVFPDTEPMPVTERDGRLYCPGVGDDTSNLAILMMTVKYLILENRPPNRRLLFVANSCEEGLGNLKGCRTLMEELDCYSVCEVISFDLNLDTVYTRAVGSERYRITATTEGGHSYGNFGNKNAIREIASLIDKLYAQPIPTDGDSKTTYNVGTIVGGTSVNTIAEAAEILYEYRSDSNLCLTVMRRQLEEIIDAAKAEGNAELTVENIGTRPGMGICRDTDAQETLIRRAEAAVEQVTGKAPVRSSGSTDCNIPFSMGIPTVCFGLIHGTGAHTRNESIETDSLPIGLEVALRFVNDYFE